MITFIAVPLLILSIILFAFLVSSLFKKQENELKEKLMKSLPNIINGKDNTWILCDVNNNVISFTSLIGKHSFLPETFSNNEYNLDIELIDIDEVIVTFKDIKENKSLSFRTNDVNVLYEVHTNFTNFTEIFTEIFAN